MADNNKTHLFLKPCGCLAAAMIDDPKNYRELGNALRMVEKRHETYKIVDTEEVRKMPWTCPEHKKIK